ncbi:MAG: NUDIX hydrolase [Pirellulaceae bacterium]|nr:NUDIX hydrolase [Pirellulaceae bacterium]MCU0981646.1 NUDIX hydrolase [Pirellulaceae bacterium]
MHDRPPAEERLLLVTRRFRVKSVQETTPDGTPRQREVIRHAGSVAIVPVVDENHVCLIRNFRVSAGKTLVEIPAGTLEPDEDPRAAALRELAEETGYRADRLELLTACYLSPGILDERMHVFVATGLTLGPAAREPGEQIENLVVTWDEAIQQIRDGTIEDAKTIVGVLGYLRFRASAKQINLPS